VATKNLLSFLYVAKASCGEVRSQLYVALDQSFVTSKDCDDLTKSLRRLSIMISNLIDYLKKQPHEGIKVCHDVNKSELSTPSETV
jgi:hypothetical protein